MGGCPVAIGSLWDAYDRDIDRLAMADALLRSSGLYHNTPTVTRPSLDAKAFPLEEEDCATLPLCVARALSTVRMRFLIGAAPVCYGLPVTCRFVAS